MTNPPNDEYALDDSLAEGNRTGSEAPAENESALPAGEAAESAAAKAAESAASDAPLKAHHTHLKAEDLLLQPADGGHHHHHHHHKKRHPVRKALIAVLCALLSIVLIAGATVLILRENGRSALLDMSDVQLTAPTTDAPGGSEIDISDNGQRVLYKGQAYRFNENRTNILCMGTDKTELGLTDGVVGTGGQADTILLLSLDTATGQLDVLVISRDTMTDIDLYNADGSFAGSQNLQLCLAFAYGDGREKSCENLLKSVQRLLYGIPINTYFAMDVSSIALLNDAIGGVEVTLPEAFLDTHGVWHDAGERLTLYGDNAMRFVRTRDKTQLDSNDARMERQKQYLNAFFSKTMSASKADLQVPITLFQTVSADSVSTLDASKITFLATNALEHGSSLSFHHIPGTFTEDEHGSAQFHADETALYELVLKLFYEKVN